MYSMLGYQKLSFNDIKRQAKRKREKLEDNDDDLKDEKEPSQKMATLDELLQEVVIVEKDDKPLPIPDASQNIEDSQSLKYLDYSLLTDPDTICLLASSLTMVVMRGCLAAASLRWSPPSPGCIPMLWPALRTITL